MKAEINKDGYIVITAESIVECFALKQVAPLNEPCDKCGRVNIPIIIDASLLMSE